MGYCVGNEGLEKRYKLEQLSTVMQSLRTLTGKPVTTTEELEDYSDKALLQLGDWVFPNVHPYFHNQLDPDAAVRWTKAAYDDVKNAASDSFSSRKSASRRPGILRVGCLRRPKRSTMWS